MCTNISLPKKSPEDPVISARTMDYIKKLPSSVNFVPRGQVFPEIDFPDEIHWNNKYGFIGIGHQFQGYPTFIYSDGLNEEGLSAAALWLPCGTYPHIKPNTSFIYNCNLINYVLGNYKNIQEVKEGLTKLTVIDSTPIQTYLKCPQHYIISDAEGNHLIIEYINGKMQTYTNQLGLLTNEPNYDWHLTNLYNYDNLSLSNTTKQFMGAELIGSGQIGSPGDPTSISRFVRGFFLKRCTFKPKNLQHSIGIALQLLQTLSIPCGTVLKSNSNNYTWTQLGVIRDHTNCSLYFYTAFNSRLYGLHLKNMNFNTLKQKYIHITQPDWYTDLSKIFEPVNCPINNLKNKTNILMSRKKHTGPQLPFKNLRIR